jgi:hypothetical protein
MRKVMLNIRGFTWSFTTYILSREKTFINNSVSRKTVINTELER